MNALASAVQRLSIPVGPAVEVEAEVSVEVHADRGRTVDVQFHIHGSRVSTASREELVDAVILLPEVAGAEALRASLPLGDAGILSALRRHCLTVDTRAAGATCLVDAIPRHNP
jgi:hypothetical protein